MAKKKSNFYHVRYNRVGLNADRTAEILGVTVDDIFKWDKEGAPVMTVSENIRA